MPRDSRWLTVGEVAALVSVDPTTVWRWQRAGQLDAIRQYKPGRHVFYWRDDVVEFVRRRGGQVDEPSTG